MSSIAPSEKPSVKDSAFRQTVKSVQEQKKWVSPFRKQPYQTATRPARSSSKPIDTSTVTTSTAKTNDSVVEPSPKKQKTDSADATHTAVSKKDSSFSTSSPSKAAAPKASQPNKKEVVEPIIDLGGGLKMSESSILEIARKKLSKNLEEIDQKASEQQKLRELKHQKKLELDALKDQNKVNSRFTKFKKKLDIEKKKFNADHEKKVKEVEASIASLDKQIKDFDTKTHNEIDDSIKTHEVNAIAADKKLVDDKEITAKEAEDSEKTNKQAIHESVISQKRSEIASRVLHAKQSEYELKLELLQLQLSQTDREIEKQQGNNFEHSAAKADLQTKIDGVKQEIADNEALIEKSKNSELETTKNLQASGEELEASKARLEDMKLKLASVKAEKEGRSTRLQEAIQKRQLYDEEQERLREEEEERKQKQEEERLRFEEEERSRKEEEEKRRKEEEKTRVIKEEEQRREEKIAEEKAAEEERLRKEEEERVAKEKVAEDERVAKENVAREEHLAQENADRKVAAVAIETESGKETEEMVTEGEVTDESKSSNVSAGILGSGAIEVGATAVAVEKSVATISDPIKDTVIVKEAVQVKEPVSKTVSSISSTDVKKNRVSKEAAEEGKDKKKSKRRISGLFNPFRSKSKDQESKKTASSTSSVKTGGTSTAVAAPATTTVTGGVFSTPQATGDVKSTTTPITDMVADDRTDIAAKEGDAHAPLSDLDKSCTGKESDLPPPPTSFSEKRADEIDIENVTGTEFDSRVVQGGEKPVVAVLANDSKVSLEEISAEQAKGESEVLAVLPGTEDATIQELKPEAATCLPTPPQTSGATQVGTTSDHPLPTFESVADRKSGNPAEPVGEVKSAGSTADSAGQFNAFSATVGLASTGALAADSSDRVPQNSTPAAPVTEYDKNIPVGTVIGSDSSAAAGRDEASQAEVIPALESSAGRDHFERGLGPVPNAKDEEAPLTAPSTPAVADPLAPGHFEIPKAAASLVTASAPIVVAASQPRAVDIPQSQPDEKDTLVPQASKGSIDLSTDDRTSREVTPEPGSSAPVTGKNAKKNAKKRAAKKKKKAAKSSIESSPEPETPLKSVDKTLADGAVVGSSTFAGPQKETQSSDNISSDKDIVRTPLYQEPGEIKIPDNQKFGVQPNVPVESHQSELTESLKSTAASQQGVSTLETIGAAAAGIAISGAAAFEGAKNKAIELTTGEAEPAPTSGYVEPKPVEIPADQKFTFQPTVSEPKNTATAGTAGVSIAHGTDSSNDNNASSTLGAIGTAAAGLAVTGAATFEATKNKAVDAVTGESKAGLNENNITKNKDKYASEFTTLDPKFAGQKRASQSDLEKTASNIEEPANDTKKIESVRSDVEDTTTVGASNKAATTVPGSFPKAVAAPVPQSAKRTNSDKEKRGSVFKRIFSNSKKSPSPPPVAEQAPASKAVEPSSTTSEATAPTASGKATSAKKADVSFTGAKGAGVVGSGTAAAASIPLSSQTGGDEEKNGVVTDASKGDNESLYSYREVIVEMEITDDESS